MAKMILVAAVMMMMCLGVGPAHAITVQIFQCTGFQSGCSTLIQTLGSTTTPTVGLVGTYNQLSILSGSVAISQTTTVKSMRLSAVLKGGSTGGSFLIRMVSGPSEYGLQPGGKNYPNSLALDGSWVGGTTPQIKAVLTANAGDAAYQTTVDQPSALPTVTVVFAGNLFSRLQNTKTESIYLPAGTATCTDPAGQSVTTCNRNRHRKDLFITIRANQTINMGETVVTATSEHDVANGGRAHVNRFLLCAAEGKQFQMGTTSAEKNYLMTPHSPLATDPNRPNSAPPTFPVQFNPALASKDGTETLLSIPSPHDNDESNDSQFNMFLPCQPITFADISHLSATFRPVEPFTVNGSPSDACKGTLRWVFDLVDKSDAKTIVEVLYGRLTDNFDQCAFYSGENILTNEARYLVDGVLKTRSQLNSLNKNLVTSLKLDLDGRRAVVGDPIAITVVLSSLRVNSDTYSFPSQLQVAYCPPGGPDHGFGIQITRIDPTTLEPTDPPTVILQDRVSTSGCKISVNADTRVDFVGPGLYRIDVLNNLTVQDAPGFIIFNQ